MATTSMINYTAVLPYAYEPYFKDCMDSAKIKILAIDNTVDNLGVAASWNIGIDCMEDAEWLIIISATMRFGEPGGTDMLEQLEKHPEADVVHFASLEVPEQPYIRGKTAGVHDGIFGWWLTALNRRLINKVGRFDEHFYPVYFEDVDYDWRINRDYPQRKWLVLPIDADSCGIGHGVSLGKVEAPAQPNLDYFVKKWGRKPEGPYEA